MQFPRCAGRRSSTRSVLADWPLCLVCIEFKSASLFHHSIRHHLPFAIGCCACLHCNFCGQSMHLWLAVAVALVCDLKTAVELMGGRGVGIAVAKDLRVSVARLLKKCREFGILRWPYRHVSLVLNALIMKLRLHASSSIVFFHLARRHHHKRPAGLHACGALSLPQNSTVVTRAVFLTDQGKTRTCVILPLADSFSTSCQNSNIRGFYIHEQSTNTQDAGALRPSFVPFSARGLLARCVRVSTRRREANQIFGRCCRVLFFF